MKPSNKQIAVSSMLDAIEIVRATLETLTEEESLSYYTCCHVQINAETNPLSNEEVGQIIENFISKAADEWCLTKNHIRTQESFITYIAHQFDNDSYSAMTPAKRTEFTKRVKELRSEWLEFLAKYLEEL